MTFNVKGVLVIVMVTTVCFVVGHQRAPGQEDDRGPEQGLHERQEGGEGKSPSPCRMSKECAG